MVTKFSFKSLIMSYKKYLNSKGNLNRYASDRLRRKVTEVFSSSEAEELSSSESETNDECDSQIYGDIICVGEVNTSCGLYGDECEIDEGEDEASDEEANESCDEYDFETFDEDISDESDNEDCESSSGYSNPVVLLILAFYLRHNLTWIALEHLLQLINEIKPGAAPTTKYHFLKLLPSSRKPKYHYYCRKCMLYLGQKQELMEKYGDSNIKCENCDFQFSLKKKNLATFFIQLDLVSQINNIVQRFKQHFSTSNIEKAVNGFSDIKCGSVYKTLKEKYQNLISLTFNTDGVKIYKSRKRSSLWPLVRKRSGV